MKTSIIVPCFKNESCIAYVLEDVRRQTCQDWELFVIGNGPGQEAQRKVVESFAEKDERISYITLAEQGVSRARNKGIEESTGEWIAFVDADDRLPACWLENYISHASMSPDMIVGGISYKYMGIGRIRRVDLGLNADEVYSQSPKEFIPFFLSDMAAMYSPCSKLYNARFLKDSGVRFAEDISVYEDGIFNLQLALVCNSMCFFKQTGYMYCLHSESSAIGRYHQCMAKAVKIRREAMRGVLRRGGYGVSDLNRRVASLLEADALDVFLNLYRLGSGASFSEKSRLLAEIFENQELGLAWHISRPPITNLPLVLFRLFYLMKLHFLCVLTFHFLFSIRKFWR